MRGGERLVKKCSWMSGIYSSLFHSTGKFKTFSLAVAAPHQSFLAIGSEAPIAKKSSFPSGEAKNCNRTLSPFNERLSYAGARADAIRPYGSRGKRHRSSVSSVPQVGGATTSRPLQRACADSEQHKKPRRMALFGSSAGEFLLWERITWQRWHQQPACRR